MTLIMTRDEIVIGKKVFYHPTISAPEKEPAVITSEVYDICGSECCKIDIRAGVVDIEALTED